MLDEKITYEILDDGTCSYCGRPANTVELPDGSLTTSHICFDCENFNTELDFQEWWSNPDATDF